MPKPTATATRPAIQTGQSAVIAKLQVGVLGTVKRCNESWCRIVGEGFDGWIAQERLWGVYPNEKVD